MSVPITDMVSFTRNMPVTNEACCSSARQMCRKCAAAALLASGVNVNLEDTMGDESTAEQVVLNQPVENEQPPPPVSYFGAVPGVAPQVQGVVQVSDTMSWNRMFAEDSARRRSQRRQPARVPQPEPVTNTGEESPLLPVTAAQHGY
jgi:hypothetical protein